jgi:tripartite-type tricarboxylate transporter receptor subunit TctC
MKRSFLIIGLFYIVVYTSSIGVPTLQAQPYPSHPIQIIIPMDPGSAGDMVLRPFSEELGKILRTPIIVVNKPGAAATLGTDIVVKSKKDGYTILYANTSAVVYAKASNPETVPYDPVKDLEPLGLHCFFPLTVTVQENSPLKTFADLVNFAKKNPGSVRVSTPGQGSIDHFNLEIIQSLTGTQFTMVPFKGGAAAITALLGGHVDVACIANSLSGPHVKAGKLRILLLTNKMREYPNVPTITELAYKQDLLSAWFALYAPAGISEEVKKVLIPAIEKTIKNPELEAKIEKLGFIVDYKSPTELKKLMMSDYEIARSLAVKLGLSK